MCPALHNAIKKYGKDNFSYEILHAVLLDNQLDELEVRAIKEHNTMSPNGYNLTTGGGTSKEMSLETRNTISKKVKQRWQNPEYKKRMSDAHSGENNGMFGKTHSLDTRKKISEANKGRTSQNKGKKLSPETRKKISEAHKGKSGTLHTEETKRRISEAQTRRWQDPNKRRKASEANKLLWQDAKPRKNI